MLADQMYLNIFLLYFLFTNIVSLGLFAWDKQRARRGAWRIKERTLLLWAILGGSLGGLLGMYAFRHKTQHFKFKWGLPLIILLQAGLIFYLCR